MNTAWPPRFAVVMVGFAVSVAVAPAVAAQCRVPSSSNEAGLLAYYAAPLTFSALGVPQGLRAGGMLLGLEITYIPAPPDALRQTSLCFRPKEENTHLAPILPRPRLTVGLPLGLQLEASYLPPVTLLDATPNLFGMALSRTWYVSPGATLSLRAHLTRGWVRGPVTCDRRSLQLQDPMAACYGAAPSRDRYSPNVTGLQLSLGRELGSRLRVGLAGGWSMMEPRFQVWFRDATGFLDSTRVVASLRRWNAQLAFEYTLNRKATAVAAVFSVPEDVNLVRLGFNFAGW